jgi:hypothetical protein
LPRGIFGTHADVLAPLRQLRSSKRGVEQQGYNNY